MARLHYNGVSGTLGGSLTNSGTTITLAGALTHSGGTNVPTIASPDYLPLSILNSSGNLSEIIYLTAYTSGATTGTISRGQESTTGVSHSAGDAVTHASTAADILNIVLSDTRPTSPAVGLVRIGLAAASTLAADTFNRADSTGLGTSSGGQTWTAIGGVFDVSSNQAKISSYGGPTSGGLAVIDCGAGDVTITCDFPVVASTPGLVGRYVDTSNFIRFGTSSAIIKVAGTDTSLGTYSSNLVTGDTLAVVLSGSSITVKRNGTTVLSASNSNLTTATKHGIALLATGSVADRWDNFSVTS
jgi:hypothetical protein